MRHVVKSVTVAIIVLIAAALPATGMEDTPEHRAEQADYYLRVVPAQALTSDMAGELAATLPENQRAGFIVMMTKNLDMAAVTRAMRASMIKSFSAARQLGSRR